VNQRNRKLLEQHDKAITEALESVSNLITDAFRNGTENPESPWGSDPDTSVLQVAQIGALQAVVLALRSHTAHTIVSNIDIVDELHALRHAPRDTVHADALQDIRNLLQECSTWTPGTPDADWSFTDHEAVGALWDSLPAILDRTRPTTDDGSARRSTGEH